MSSMMEALAGEPGNTQQSTPFAANAMSFRIKRSGARPLVFQGSELAMAMSYTPAIPYWYEINIYRMTDQRFVVAIKLFFQSEDEKDSAQAWECDDLDAAFSKIETYDAGQDVRVNMMPGGTGMGAAELAATALEWRARIEAARAHYGSLVGEFFHELEQAA